MAFPSSLVPHLARAVVLVVPAVHAPDFAPQLLVPPCPRRAALRVCLTRTVLAVAGWRDLELSADRLDTMLGPLSVDEGVHQRAKRSSSAAGASAAARRSGCLAEKLIRSLESTLGVLQRLAPLLLIGGDPRAQAGTPQKAAMIRRRSPKLRCEAGFDQRRWTRDETSSHLRQRSSMVRREPVFVPTLAPTQFAMVATITCVGTTAAR